MIQVEFSREVSEPKEKEKKKHAYKSLNWQLGPVTFTGNCIKTWSQQWR